MAALPTGTVTFLLTDVEGSTRLWEQHPEAMRTALVQHDAIVEFLAEQHGGCVVRPRGEGDSRFCVFARATDAVAAAAAIQRALHEEPWPATARLQVRMALHTGEADLRDEDYYGSAVNRCARLRAIAHGGQTLVSRATSDMAGERLPTGVALRDLGEQRLKDLTAPERVFQLAATGQPDDFPPLRSLDAVPNNLPIQLTSFVGRQRELAEVARLLSRSRLITLTGTGGAGKTRLALQVAGVVADGYADGVWFVDLAPIADEALVAPVVLTTLGGREAPGRGPAAALADYLRERAALVVLDNCEHLLGACATLADAVLRACPRVRLLATSRELLGIAGETAWRVPSLGVPPDGAAAPEELAGREAVRLFVERAQAVRPGFGLSAGNAPAVAQICRRLDGIPLAIELAAARARALSPPEIAARLDDRFRLLTGGSRTALRRQQTLQALVDWSHDLLTEPERVVLRRLSVFAGGWTIAAAEAVVGADPIGTGEVLDLLAGLVDKSLVVAEEGEAGTRYRLLETIRQYAADRLREAGELADARGRHRDWFAALGDRASPHLFRTSQGDWLAQLEADHDNLRAALDYCEADPASGEVGLRLATLLAEHLWRHRGHASEGVERLERLLAVVPARTVDRARALLWSGVLQMDRGALAGADARLTDAVALARESGETGTAASALVYRALAAACDGPDLPAMRARLEEALPLALGAGDRYLTADVYLHLGQLHVALGDYGQARALLERSLGLMPSDNPWGVARALFRLGILDRLGGDYGAARARIAEGHRLLRELGSDFATSYAAMALAALARDEGNYDEARSRLAEAVRLMRRSAPDVQMAPILCSAALLAGAQGDQSQATRLFAASAGLNPAAGVHAPELYAETESGLERARAVLGDDAFRTAWAAGQAMTLDQAIAHALDDAAQ